MGNLLAALGREDCQESSQDRDDDVADATDGAFRGFFHWTIVFIHTDLTVYT